MAGHHPRNKRPVDHNEGLDGASVAFYAGPIFPTIFSRSFIPRLVAASSEAFTFHCPYRGMISYVLWFPILTRPLLLFPIRILVFFVSLILYFCLCVTPVYMQSISNAHTNTHIHDYLMSSNCMLAGMYSEVSCTHTLKKWCPHASSYAHNMVSSCLI